MSDIKWSLEYTDARRRFRQAANAAKMDCDSFAAPGAGPGGEPLSLDVARAERPTGNRGAVVVSSGLHGVEGAVGSNVQTHLLAAGWADRCASAGWRLILLHALNPYGFAWSRRADLENIDVNRNFLVGEPYQGVTAPYRSLQRWLNPPRSPSRPGHLLFYPRAFWEIARSGMPALKQAIAPGQYEYPRGLFFGGRRPSWTHRTLADRLDDWLDDAERIVHFDIHTGLGKWGGWVLLLDYPIEPWQRRWLDERFQPEQWQDASPEQVAYHARGAWGNWCGQRFTDRRYFYLCAEFGAYSPIRTLAALRSENQAHHELGSVSPNHWTKRLLRETFCPAAPPWRRGVESAMEGMLQRCIHLRN